MRAKLRKTSTLTKVFLLILAVPAASWVVAQGMQALSTPDGTVERGITMAEVRVEKGEPSEEIGPVGDPAIYKWLYENGEIVVFEENRVLDSFFRRN